MWTELEERYGIFNGAQIIGLHKELTVISQGNQSVSSLITKINMLWDDIDSLFLVHVCTRGCKCGAAQKTTQFHQNQRVIQFLMGLNDSYHMMRSSILMKSHLPTLGHAYSLLLQEEAQKEIHSTSHFLSVSAFLTVNSSKSQFKEKINAIKSLHCTYFKKPGNLIENCYKLHGFSSDFKFTKNKKFTA